MGFNEVDESEIVEAHYPGNVGSSQAYDNVLKLIVLKRLHSEDSLKAQYDARNVRLIFLRM